MSLPPPGLGGGAARTGPPPGFGSFNMSGGNSTGGSGRNGDSSATSVTRTQIVFLISTLSEDTYDKSVAELRTMAMSDGPDIYLHFIRRVAHTASSYIASLNEHFQLYKEDPAAPPPTVPTHGLAFLAWRLLMQEAFRAARDVTLAPLFASVVLSPMTQTALPLQSLHLLDLPPHVLFTFTAFALASTNVFPSAHPSQNHLRMLLHQTRTSFIDVLRTRGSNFWTQQIPNQPIYSEDISMQEARTLILAVYPRPEDGRSQSRPATPTNPTLPHTSPLNTYERGEVLNALAIKFGSPAIIAQTLPALSPAGRPRSPASIPLEHILFELGEAITSDEQTVQAVVHQWWGPWLLENVDSAQITEEVTRTVHGICAGLTRDGHQGRYLNEMSVAKVLSTLPDVQWQEVFKSFDQQPRATFKWNQRALLFLVSLIYLPPQNPIPPIAGLLPASLDAPLWDNLATLYEILGHLLKRWSPDVCPVFVIPHAPAPSAFARIVDPPEHSDGVPDNVEQEAMDLQNAGVYNALGLIRILVAGLEQADSDHATADMADLGRMASDILRHASSIAPELVLLGLEKLDTPLPAPAIHLQQTLMAQYLRGFDEAEGDKSSGLVFHHLWTRDGEGLVSRLLEFYTEDETRLERVVDIAKGLGILNKLLELDHTHLAFDVAALAAGKEEINLERWLADALEAKGDDLLHCVFDFIEHKTRLEFDYRLQPDSDSQPPFALSPAIYSTFLRVIRNAQDLSPNDVRRFKQMRTDVLILHPRLLNFLPGSKEEPGLSEKRFSKETAQQTDSMYRSMYNGETTLDDFVQQLKQLQASSDPADRELYASCLHSIFDEYRFMKNYPAKELTKTGILFGGIIDSRVIKDIPAFVATRYVLDACKTNPNEAMYSYGLNVLSVLRRSLVDFPGLCRSLLEIPALHESHAVLINDIVAALAERDELDQQGGVKLAFPALKLPILVEEGYDEFKEPDAKKRDAIMFIINQIAPSNYEAKCRDLLKLFEEQYSRWFAHYFIDVRVSLEPNRHELYMNIVESIGSPVLEKHILWETYRKIRDLINAEATISSAAERTSLKTCALWLGRVTLARNKPVRLRELSVKDLLMQGFDNKRLIVAIPFVCNLLVSCKESKVFHLPNPWMVAVLSLLVEFYHFAELRLNLKFEIEVLFSKLDIPMDSVSPSSLLRTHVPPPPAQEDIPDRLELEFQRATSEIPTNQRFEAPGNEALARIQQIESEAAAQESQELFLARVDELVARLPEQLVFSHDYPIFTAPTSKRIVHDAIARAIRDIITPVVERSVTIAGISTRDIVSKDFGMEGDPTKMRYASHAMVQNLAGNLALVTCKEPLRAAMVQNVRSILSQNGFTDDNMPDAMINGVVSDNLDVACSVVKVSAMEKASKDIDVNLNPQFSARKAHRDARNPHPFSDAASFGVLVSHASLPDPLRLRSGGLSSAQMRVYEEFAEPAKMVASVNGDGSVYRDTDHERTGYQQELDSHSMAHSPQPPAMSPAVCVQRFVEIAAEIDKIVAQGPAHSISGLPTDHELRSLILNVRILAGHSSNRDQAALYIAQKVVQFLFKSTTTLGREAYTLTLQQLCETSPNVNQEVRDWLLHADDKRKLNVPVTVTLMKAGMMGVAELDRQLAQMVLKTPPDASAIDFAADLIGEVSTGEHPMYPRNAFAVTLAAMLKLQEAGLETPSVKSLIDIMRGASRRPSVVENGDRTVIDEKMHDRLKHLFLEWVRLFRKTDLTERAFVPYIQHLQKEGILSGDDVSSAFFQTAINVAVDGDSGKTGQDESFIGTDSLARLVILMVKVYDEKSGSPNLAGKVYYFNKILTILSYTLVERHLELGEAFDQRPWARLFTSMLAELDQLEGEKPKLYQACLHALANVLGHSQPTYAPRFAFGWMSIISHRSFMPRLLAHQEDWPEFHRCLMWLLRFAAPFLRQAELNPSSRRIYRGISRIFCVLLHDFPDFLDEHYHTLSTAIPPNCLQLRNIVISSFPADVGPLPDQHRGFAQLQADMQRFPRIRQDYSNTLQAGGIKAAIDQFVREGAPQSQAIVGELRNRIAVKTSTPEGMVITWNHTLLHAAVHYIGTTCVTRITNQRGIVEFDPNAPEVRLLTELAMAMNNEGQYYFVGVVVDQLRYPSAHSHFYISFILYLFPLAVNSEQPNSIGERISRVLLERVLSNKPYPWGLVLCFIELLQDPAYMFWDQPFVQAEPEIHALFLRASHGIRQLLDHQNRAASSQM